jgi:alanine dehydrogenase
MSVFLSERDVRAALSMPALVAAMERAVAEFSAGRVAQPVRTVLEVGSTRSFFGVMPAATINPPALGAKLVTVFHANHSRGLPSHLATIVLLDPETGARLAVMDGRYITEARTAAVSAVSVRYLARPDACTLAIIGSGVQARSHLEAIECVRPLREVRVWSPVSAHRAAFARQMAPITSAPIRPCETATDAVRGADIVVLATSAASPVVGDDDVVQGSHIVAVGACRPDQREMPTNLVRRGRVFVDSRAAAMREAGDLLLPMAEGAVDESHVAGELGDVVLGRVTGRQSESEITIFKSLGMAVEDVVAARLALDEAVRAGLGQKLEDA